MPKEIVKRWKGVANKNDDVSGSSNVNMTGEEDCPKIESNEMCLNGDDIDEVDNLWMLETKLTWSLLSWPKHM